MIELLITAQGIVRALYTEAIPIHVFGSVQIERASRVEPDAAGNWWADLQPSQGPVLGPFTYRSEALQAEQDWLTQHVLFGSPVTEKKVEKLTDDKQPSHEGTSDFDAVAGYSSQATAGDPDLPGQRFRRNLQQHTERAIREAGRFNSRCDSRR